MKRRKYRKEGMKDKDKEKGGAATEQIINKENERRRGLKPYIQRGEQVLGSVVSQPSQTQRKHPLETITKSAGEERRRKLIEKEERKEVHVMKKKVKDDYRQNNSC